ncbi:MAG: hypothetical protein COU11_00635 [Candidatus Harrisonbacteria bacterium CG10_big_fil_rev_8_21_14_0_10_49_15]|uniref:Methyltransferase type 11 domain-containing protein n=1 Tax=Candidatus Harrisonbacteria bacterium CG10_big_fil_rev_8_21_14_0_10_49_15 TaxID=1974587 RepID=A0A2H0UM05_9BACT|nr:MAG: hypothetical protein COU11_00635 [Candidatus Harrisonbacteria bacterium CG10_big_fil_rev_8_21_14_0_10_49_15]
MEQKIRLHLGCGEKYLPGYINIDYPADQHSVMKVRADKYADLRELSYPDNSVDEVRSHHVFEHFNRAEALKMLSRWRRWLKPGGVLLIETPDFEGCIWKFFFSGRKRRLELIRHIFGSQEAAWADHLDGWYARKYRFVLSSFGFTKVRIRRYSNSVSQRKFPRFRFIANFLGDLLPDSMYKKYGGHKLPNIEVTAVKSDKFIDERVVAREVLSRYLVGREGAPLLDVWLKDFE